MGKPGPAGSPPIDPQSAARHQQTREIALVDSLLDRSILFHRPLVRVTGSVWAALFLSQLKYWTPRGKNPKGWIYKTQVEWEDETGLTQAEQQTARKLLVKLGFLEEKLRGVPARLYYRIKMDRLADALADPDSSYPRHGKLVTRNTVGKFTATRVTIPESTIREISPETTEAIGAPASQNRSPEHPEISKPASPVSKQHTSKHSASRERKLKTQADPKSRSEEALPVPPRAAAAPTDPFLVAGFDRLWAVIPKRISTGSAKVEAFEFWKTLTPVPNRHHVHNMIALLEAYREESPDFYGFFDFDGSAKVTPARLIALLCQAMKEGRPLGNLLDDLVTA